MLAIDRGWAINVGGGFHHCSADHGGGFCVYADISLAIHYLFESTETVRRAMIVDLDAHQGNGHERDFKSDERVYIMDVYNGRIYPHDSDAKRGIRRNVAVEPLIEDYEYLSLVTRHLQDALAEFHPDIVLYNAGTDVLEGDRLGLLSISENGVVERDETVFRIVRSRNIPIVMVMSGGYQRRTAEVIARSILNLHRKGLIEHNSDVDVNTDNAL
jgi:histone deacetylase 11